MAAAGGTALMNPNKSTKFRSGTEKQISKGRFVFLAICLFVTTSPIFGEIATVAFTLASLITLLFTVKFYNRSAVTMILCFIALVLPMTLYDLFQSVDRGFVTLSFLAIPTFLIFGFVLSQSTSEADLFDVYEKIILYLSIPSSVVYLLFFLFPEIAYSAPEYNFRESTHRTFIVLNVLLNPDLVMRNSGFASEPGFYQILINVALYIRLKRLKRPDFVCMFYAVVVLSTLSTAGIVVTAFLLSTVLTWQYRVILLMLVLFFLGIVQEFVLEQYKIKVENDIVFDRRFTPSANAILFFLENPFGIGAFQYIYVYERLDIGSWDAFTQIALRYGLLGLLGLGFLFSNLFKRNPVLLSLLCLSFLTSPIWFYPAIAILYFPTKSNTET